MFVQWSCLPKKSAALFQPLFYLIIINDFFLSKGKNKRDFLGIETKFPNIKKTDLKIVN